MTEEEGTSTGNFRPPYVSYQAFADVLERLWAADEDLPPRLDRSYLGSMSTAQSAQVMAALRAVGFIDSAGAPTSTLMEYLRSDDAGQRRVMGQILRSRYAEAVRASRQSATHGHLEEVFDRYGLKGATKRKAIAFFIRACEHADLPVSPNFRRRQRSGRTSQPPRRRSPGTTRRVDGTEAPLTGIRVEYISTLLERVQSGESDPELLDRIERLLGLQDGA